jgi:predicted TIM-barrel fold metal-dependent hydrolase
VRVFGPHRWVFGLGYPQAEGGAVVAGLSYARIPDAAKAAIAYGNFARLLGETKCSS